MITNKKARLHFGNSRWNDIKKVLGWKGNFIAGYRVYVVAWLEPAYGKSHASPSDADTALQWMVDNGYLCPVKLAVQPERAPWVGSYMKHILTSKVPIPGGYIDWDYGVLFDVEKFPPKWDREVVTTAYEKRPYTRLRDVGVDNLEKKEDRKGSGLLERLQSRLDGK